MPWALLTAAIVNLLMVIWIIVYICAIYQRDKVYITTGKNGSDDDQGWYHDEDGQSKMRYAKQSKQGYIIGHALEPILYAIVFSIAYFWTRDWVKKH